MRLLTIGELHSDGVGGLLRGVGGGIEGHDLDGDASLCGSRTDTLVSGMGWLGHGPESSIGRLVLRVYDAGHNHTRDRGAPERR